MPCTNGKEMHASTQKVRKCWQYLFRLMPPSWNWDHPPKSAKICRSISKRPTNLQNPGLSRRTQSHVELQLSPFIRINLGRGLVDPWVMQCKAKLSHWNGLSLLGTPNTFRKQVAVHPNISMKSLLLSRDITFPSPKGMRYVYCVHASLTRTYILCRFGIIYVAVIGCHQCRGRTPQLPKQSAARSWISAHAMKPYP